MEINIYIKTNRTKSGYARARLTRFMNYSNNKIRYSFQFYQTHKFFNTYKELRDYVMTNYETYKGYQMPEERDKFFS